MTLIYKERIFGAVNNDISKDSLSIVEIQNKNVRLKIHKIVRSKMIDCANISLTLKSKLGTCLFISFSNFTELLFSYSLFVYLNPSMIISTKSMKFVY